MDVPQSSIQRENCDTNSRQNPGDMSSSIPDRDNVKRAKTDLVVSEEQSSINNSALHPLSMGHIVQEILFFLDVDSIKVARRVNELWRDEGAKVLVAKCYLRSPCRTLNEPNKYKYIAKFKSFLSSLKLNDVSMIQNITIETPLDIELWKAFGVLEPQVRELKLDLDVDEKAELLHDLFNLLPNLKYLRVQDGQFDSKRRPIIKVLTSAMSKPKRNANPLVISFMTLKPESVEEFKDIEKLADCKNIMVEKLEFSMEPYFLRQIPLAVGQIPVSQLRINHIIPKFLSTSQNILKSLTFRYCETSLESLDFPVMTTLNFLHLEFYHRGSEHSNPHQFSPSFQFSEKMPNLHDLNIEYTGNDEDNASIAHLFRNLFATTGIAPSVKSLDYPICDSTVGSLFDIFPSMENFESLKTQDFKTVLRQLLEHGKNLKTLGISVHVDELFGNVSELDSIVTGLSIETVNTMKESTKLKSYTCEELEKMRVGPSILDLKDLQTLSIRLDGTNSRKYIPKRTLAVAGEYAFKMMPSTKIKIIAKHNGRATERVPYDLDEVHRIPNVSLDYEDTEFESPYSMDRRSSDSGSDSESDSYNYFNPFFFY